jgi:hypothetical protein
MTTDDSTRPNGEPANIVDGLFAIARALDRLAWAVTPTFDKNLVAGFREIERLRAQEEKEKASANGTKAKQ